VEQKHEFESGIVGGVRNRGTDRPIHHHQAPEGTAGCDKPEDKAEQGAGEEVNHERAEINQLGEMGEQGKPTDGEDEADGAKMRN